MAPWWKGGERDAKDRPRKEADFQIVGDRFKKQKNLYKSCPGGSKTNRSLCLSTRTFKVYTEALPWFSHIYDPGGLNNALLSTLHP